MPLPRPRRTSTAVALHCDLFRVLRHEASAEGVSREIYTFEMPDWVSVAAMTEEGEVVLVRQHRHGIDEPTLETPGGIVDPGETPQAAALRELREETGYQGSAAESLGWVHPNPALQQNRCHLYLARDVRRVGEPDQAADERVEPVVLARSSLRAALDEGRISHALSVVALERAFATMGPSPGAPTLAARLFATLDAMEQAQRDKVVALARRLRPGLTAEDVRNPHDFPDLDDTDWHFEDGQLAAIQAVRFALVAVAKED